MRCLLVTRRTTARATWRRWDEGNLANLLADKRTPESLEQAEAHREVLAGETAHYGENETRGRKLATGGDKRTPESLEQAEALYREDAGLRALRREQRADTDDESNLAERPDKRTRSRRRRRLCREVIAGDGALRREQRGDTGTKANLAVLLTDKRTPESLEQAEALAAVRSGSRRTTAERGDGTKGTLPSCWRTNDGVAGAGGGAVP